MNGKPMIGLRVVDHKKNTNRAKRVNDRLRRTQKRIEKSDWRAELKQGALANTIIRK